MPLPIVQGEPPAGGRRLNVFLSYAREDDEFAASFAKHFDILARSMKPVELDFFYDTQRLLPGYRWDETLHAFLDRADLLVFLVSADSLSSDSYCMTHEVPSAAAAGIPIVPVVVRQCFWKPCPIPGDLSGATFGQMGAVPAGEDDIRPVGEWPQQDAAWFKVLEQLIQTLQTLQPRAAAVPEARPAADAPRDAGSGARTDLVAYLCNQDDPEWTFRESVRNWPRDPRALVVLVKGVFDDNPGRFWERLRIEFLLDIVERGPLRGPPLYGDKPFRLPRKRSRWRFREEMERDLLDEFSEVLTGRALDIPDAESLPEQMRTEKREGVISLFAVPRAGADAAREGIEALLRLIEKLPEDITARLVVVVNLEDPALLALDLVTEWRLRRFKRTLVVDLDPLSAVTEKDARDWYQLREIGTLYQVSEEEVIRLFAEEPTLRMRPFDTRLQPLLGGRGRPA